MKRRKRNRKEKFDKRDVVIFNRKQTEKKNNNMKIEFDSLPKFLTEFEIIIPSLVEEVIWTREDAWVEHYQLLTCAIIEKTLKTPLEVKALFEWLGIPTVMFEKGGSLYEPITDLEFFRHFREWGCATTIVEKALEYLEDLDMQMA